MKKLILLSCSICFVLISFFLSSFKKATSIPTTYHQLMYSGGISGYSAAGCTCHGIEDPFDVVTLSITGLPASPIVNVTYPLVFTLNGPNPNAGFNIAVSSGTLANGDGDSQEIGGELTHSFPKGLVNNEVSFAFNWTPTSAGDATFTYAGNNVNVNGNTQGDIWKKGSITTTVQTLPVKITAWSGMAINKTTNAIFWSAEQEVNFFKYQVEHSCDGTNFSTVGTVLPQSGISYTKNYEFVHAATNCTSAKDFYRLKLLDLDGSFTYTTIVNIAKTAKEIAPALYPNPITNVNNKVLLNTGNRKVAFVQLSTANGERLQSYTRLEKIVNELTLPPNLKKGLYFITVYYQNQTKHSLSFVY
jgi:hypothetical protein